MAETPSTLSIQAFELIKSGRFEEAKELFNFAIELEPHNHHLYLSRA